MTGRQLFEEDKKKGRWRSYTWWTLPSGLKRFFIDEARFVSSLNL